MKRLVAVAALIGALTGSPAAAATIFSDNFEANSAGNLGLNKTPIGWSVTSGTVDVLTFADCIGSASGGVCVDMDGSSGNAGIMAHGIGLSVGSYLLEFWLRGNNRGGPSDTLNFSVTGPGGGTTGFIGPVASGDPWKKVTIPFAIAFAGTYSLAFENAGGDNVGVWFDDVSISDAAATPVPEPASMLLFGTGVSTLWAARRRRSRR